MHETGSRASMRLCNFSWDTAMCTVRRGAHIDSTNTATHCITLQHTVTHYNTLQHTATRCNTMQHTATHCNTLQHTATQVRRLIRRGADINSPNYDKRTVLHMACSEGNLRVVEALLENGAHKNLKSRCMLVGCVRARAYKPPFEFTYRFSPHISIVLLKNGAFLRHLSTTSHIPFLSLLIFPSPSTQFSFVILLLFLDSICRYRLAY